MTANKLYGEHIPKLMWVSKNAPYQMQQIIWHLETMYVN